MGLTGRCDCDGKRGEEETLAVEVVSVVADEEGGGGGCWEFEGEAGGGGSGGRDGDENVRAETGELVKFAIIFKTFARNWSR